MKNKMTKCFFCLTEIDAVEENCFNTTPLDTHGLGCCNPCDKEIVMPMRRIYQSLVLSEGSRFIPFTERGERQI